MLSRTYKVIRMRPFAMGDDHWGSVLIGEYSHFLLKRFYKNKKMAWHVLSFPFVNLVNVLFFFNNLIAKWLIFVKWHSLWVLKPSGNGHTPGSLVISSCHMYLNVVISGFLHFCFWMPCVSVNIVRIMCVSLCCSCFLEWDGSLCFCVEIYSF